MVNLACGVIRISNKCSCLEIFDQQGNLNLTPFVVISIYQEQSPNSIPNFSSEQLQQIVQALSALNHRSFGNSDNNINVAGLFPIFALSINSTSSNSWILDSGATDHIVSKASVIESQTHVLALRYSINKVIRILFPLY